MSDRTQYADLIREAGAQILAVNVLLEASPQLAAPMTAELVAYRDVFHALGQHGLRLLGGESGRRWIRGAVVVEQSDMTGMQLTDHLMHLGQRNYTDDPGTGVSAHWQRAADAVRAASDLLATHLDTWGDTRAPASEVLKDPAVRAAGFGELASLTIPVATAADSLGRQLVDSGSPVHEVERLVPPTRAVREVAVASRHQAQLGGVGRPLAELQVARPAVREQDPVVELQDRVARLHRVAHQLTREDRVGVCTLADLAAAGMMLNQAAANVLRAGSPADVADLSVRREVGRLEDGAAAWLDVHSQIRVLRTTTPALAGVRSDVVAVRGLIAQLTDKEPTRDVQAALIGSARRFGDVAAWNRKALKTEASGGRLLIPGRHLTGNQVSDDLTLVKAKRQGLLVPALAGHLMAAQAAYVGVEGAAAAAGRLQAQELPVPRPSSLSLQF